MRVEAAAAIPRRMRLGQLSADEARRICKDWFEALDAGAVFLLPSTDYMDAAIELAIEMRHPLQDCLYLAVARALNVPLALSDPRFHDRAKAIYSQLELITGE